MISKNLLWGASALVVAMAVGTTAPGEKAKAYRQPAAAKPVAHLPGYNPDRNAYFGDLHVHTKLSFDAYIFNVRSSPDDAYRFAKGETIGHAAGFDIRLAGGPLDFVAVTDHAEYIGAMREAATPGSPLAKLPIVSGLFSTDIQEIGKAFARIVQASQDMTMPAEFSDKGIAGRAWKEIQDAAERHNEPGRFTTFVGYEFTSAPQGRNLHRNVIFKASAVPGLPYSARDSADPEDLWRTMDGWRSRGIDSLAIPHNSNGSDGLMFEPTKRSGASMDKVYADMRRRNEPLVEITQIKGTSEVHPSLAPNDEWANFEIMESYIGSNKMVTNFKGSYVRQALKDGIAMQDNKGFNPFKFGFIGSSDTHNSAPGSVEERNYFSKTGRPDSTPVNRDSVPPGGAKTWDGVPFDPTARSARFQSWGASGLAGVWAEENSREAIYSALRRKETFATSGPRMRVRFFASYNYPEDLIDRKDVTRQAYALGVPMGGDLLGAKAGQAPKFLVWGSGIPIPDTCSGRRS